MLSPLSLGCRVSPLSSLLVGVVVDVVVDVAVDVVVFVVVVCEAVFENTPREFAEEYFRRQVHILYSSRLGSVKLSSKI